MPIEYIFIFSTQTPDLVQRYGRWWIPETERDRKRVLDALMKRPKKTPILTLYRQRKIAVRCYGDLLFAVGIDSPEYESMAFELIHLIISVLNDYYGNVTESDIIHRPDIIVHLMEYMICSGILVQPGKASLVKLLKEI
ncbi:clathrin adaptor complex small chain [Gregarina niphandrodes]|uniref:Clathrin adaptor complex small chain n=1 Tax=Gregarina niphandrodes TaxID=110365 RepID=A0A023B829_GRENI|nr:clathrin adaptor complex small chain [Gregarina niphandrodes]EZG68105.1 clathrin adaptor complex small chain [Gregarina niphandrodes]|eukprot:XP_011130090.1 clathrin adaptor complex small chain [Gregarina niphandrodes]